MALGGVIGTVSYEGEISDFMLFLRLGEYVHVGKGTSFGWENMRFYNNHLPQRTRRAQKKVCLEVWENT
jgi:CRISPR-associated endoribonuclease Cas6